MDRPLANTGVRARGLGAAAPESDIISHYFFPVKAVFFGHKPVDKNEKNIFFGIY